MSNRIATVHIDYDSIAKEYCAAIVLPHRVRMISGFSTATGLMQVVSELVADEVHTRPTLKDMTPVGEP